MISTSSNQFAAPDPALGYLYQVRLSLLWTLRKLKTTPETSVSIETLDDVEFAKDGVPTDLLQTKHHFTAQANLTDASPDLWKTLRVWFEGHSNQTIPPNANLFLLTTGIAQPDSTASYLRDDDTRDVDQAILQLDATCKTSTSTENAKAYTAFRLLSKDVLKTILNRVTVIDGAPTIVDLDNDLTDEVFWAAGKQQLSSFLERLEGWWFRRVLKQLTERDGSFIGAVELESQMTDLRQQFHPDALPIDDDLLSYELDEATYELHKSSLFVKQLGLIKAGKKRVQNAIRDYFRAYEQRSRWLRNELIVEMELHKYEKRLVDEWSTFFEAVRDEIGDKATAEEKEKAARSVLQWAEQKIVPIRINVTEPFVSRGSFQMLAQDKRIWWHSDFLDRLSELLLPEEAKK